MTPDIMPILYTRVDWPSYLIAAQKILGRSVSASLDTYNLRAEGTAAFIPTVAELRKPNSNPISAIRDNPTYGRHTFVGFLVVCDKDTLEEIWHLEHTVEITATHGLESEAVIISGTMEQWHNFVCFALSKYSSTNFRILAGKILIWMERNDFGEVWGNYQKVKQSDATFVLEVK